MFVNQLDERKAAILRAIVEHYVASAQPVGSRTVTDTAGLGVSPATVRNEMGGLEREGYITHPHTSAGRIPTDRGYRYYVDHLAGTGGLTAPERREVADFFASTVRAIDDLLNETSQLLARLTHHAAVVVGPQADVVRIRSAHLTLLQPRVVLAMVVLSNGAVTKEVVFLDEDITEEDVVVAGTHLGTQLTGSTMADIVPRTVGVEPMDSAARLVMLACEALQESDRRGGDPLYVGGASRLAAEQEAFPDATSAARVLELLEQQVVLTTVMRELLGSGLTVRIGSENGRDLRDCSLVLAPYMLEGRPAGTVGVLGPTRMDYRQARAIVVAVSNQLGHQLSR